MQKQKSEAVKLFLAKGAMVSTLALAINAQALEFDFKDSDLTIDLDTTLTYGAQWRVQSASMDYENRYAAVINSDDGTNNFDTGLVSNRITIVSEADIQWRNFGFFVRGKALYDDVYENDDTNQDELTYLTDNSGDGGGTWLNFGGAELGTLAPEDFHPDTIDLHGTDAFFLDAFLYGDFELGDKFVSARLGRQVVSWGESTFIQGISGTQNRLDESAAAAPGTQVKEIFMPTGSAYVNLELTPSISVEAYYQYEWLESQWAGVGSYWSKADFAGAGAERFLLHVDNLGFTIPVDMARTDDPGDSGQWGLAMRYLTENGTEFGFYRTAYHAKFYNVLGVADPDARGPLAALPAEMTLHYQEDVDLYGASFSTLLGSWNIVGEISYQPNLQTPQTILPVVTDGVAANGVPREAHVTQVNLGFLQIWGDNIFADGINMLGEIAYVRSNHEDDTPLQQNTQEAYAAVLSTTFNYNSIMSGVDLSIPVNFKWGIDGYWNTLTMTQNTKSVSMGARINYRKQMTAEIKYTEFWGNESNNLTHDRDNVSFSVNYTF